MTGKRLAPEQVDHVAHLARLEITAAERERFCDQLGEVLGYVNKLQELPTEDIPATLGVQPQPNVFREDVAVEPMEQSKVLANAPQAQDGGFRIP
ncbi:MAG: Asp-tRNA(Asn)/Glu-tRNA(Gln) amidotransferase subunit GatC, partial [Candidatus Eremiobacteraeota bacterium]|nr:Asp-tRNA(Asn)/Glu-tRNA(Gln) amidotransferase subunit GatC [Candidatus Eremiobacteraeota bacterium]